MPTNRVSSPKASKQTAQPTDTSSKPLSFAGLCLSARTAQPSSRRTESTATIGTGPSAQPTSLYVLNSRALTNLGTPGAPSPGCRLVHQSPLGEGGRHKKLYHIRPSCLHTSLHHVRSDTPIPSNSPPNFRVPSISRTILITPCLPITSSSNYTTPDWLRLVISHLCRRHSRLLVQPCVTALSARTCRRGPRSLQADVHKAQRHTGTGPSAQWVRLVISHVFKWGYGVLSLGLWTWSRGKALHLKSRSASNPNILNNGSVGGVLIRRMRFSPTITAFGGDGVRGRVTLSNQRVSFPVFGPMTQWEETFPWQT
jgi:hypothetical protein